MLVSLGDLSGGFTLYVKDGRFVFEYNHEGTPYRVETAAAAGPRECRRLDLAFERTGGLAGTATPRSTAARRRGKIPRTARWFISWSALDVGRDSLSRVSDAYDDDFAFTPGRLERVDFDLEAQQRPVDHQPMD